jgi:NAD-dependent deacetylase
MKIAVLTGAGISAESGIKTFRDSDGLWEGHDVMEVASPQGWKADPANVLHFYNLRRRQLLEVEPNPAHFALTELQEHFDVQIVTQNVDNLHEKAGNKNVLHLHGELLKVRSEFDENMVYTWEKDVKIGDKAEDGHQLRPDIVWFGEAVPKIEEAAQIFNECDVAIIIGTSLQVYPAAGLIDFAPNHAQVYLIDPKPNVEPNRNLHVYAENAVVATQKVVQKIISNHA